MFQVEWVPSAANDLAAVWVHEASDRHAITEATEEIDALLRRRPEDAGESRDQNRRILLASPLGIVFTIEPNQNKVRVLKVWHYRRPSSES